MVEIVSDWVHKVWARWMEYVFACSVYNEEDGTYTIPRNEVIRWKRQIATEYKDLSEFEKYSDRQLANEVIHLIGEDECLE